MALFTYIRWLAAGSPGLDTVSTVRMLSGRRGASAASGLENLSEWRHVWV
jgi:hypothetical protein